VTYINATEAFAADVSHESRTPRLAAVCAEGLETGPMIRNLQNSFWTWPMTMFSRM